MSYNVQQISNDEITRIADANFVNNLNGKVAGVTINSSSSGVGGSSRVVMRGTKSLNGNNNALYVVDGIPMIDMSAASTQPSDSFEGAGQSGDPIAGINPEDIESISVLSGPSAAALYGSAAANGVVMITTKKGKEGRTSVSISNNTTFSAPLVLPEFQNTYGQTEVGSYYSWGTKLNTPSSYDPADFFQTGVNVTNSASLSTGTDKNQTYVSLGTTNAKGIIHNNNFERYNATVRNVSKMLNDKLTLDLNFMLSSVKEQNMTAQGLYYNPLVALYLFPAGDDFSKVQAYQRYDAERNLSTQYWPYSTNLALQNPYWITERIKMPNHKNRYMATASVKYDLTDWINVTGRAKMDRNNERRERMYDAGTNTLFASKYGYYSKSNIESQQVYGELLLNINKYFLENTFNLTFNAGANFENNDYRSDYFGGKLKSTANLFTYGNVDTTEKNLANQYGYNLKKRAVFGSAQVGYKSMIYLDVTFRNDWSSTFKGTDTSSFSYGSIGLSGILTDIFPISTSIMPYMKVRVSYSEVGNSPDVFLAIPTYKLVDGVPVTMSRRPNPNLKPERTKSWEAGLNFVFFDNKLKLDASLYHSRTYNQFFERTLSSTTGYTSEVVNGGRVDNKGIELSLRLDNKWGDFGWSSYLTYSLNKNKVVELLRNYEDPYTHELTSLDRIDMGGT
ncbi:SusC/RagA family TonB-linked outer membrane protein, partial [Bacteroides congonensis]|uniref:SusC/RagA family TonB-linked outer membrane protein n=1 Tax=Bacteroides congonensis TaxID=1871006 RepID=UPI0025A47548